MLPELHWLDQVGVPVIGLMLTVPLIGLLMLTRVRTRVGLGALAVGVTAIELGLAVWLATEFEIGLHHVQFVERHAFGGLSLFLGVDGTSVLFVPLTTLLALVAAAQVLSLPADRAKKAVASILLLEWCLLGAFTSLNLVQFWLFSVIELVPLAFVIRDNGDAADASGENRRMALYRFLTFRLLGEGLVLLAIVLLGLQLSAVSPGAWSFDLQQLVAGARDHAWDSRLAIILFYGLALRLALFPFHAWLPTVSSAVWLPINMLVMVSIKVGAYALLRFAIPVLPLAVDAWADWVVALGLAGMLYGALMALLQVDLRRLIAFAAISENGSLLVGMFALNHAGLQGGLLLALNLCLATAGLYFATHLLNERTGTTRLDQLGGLFERVPLIGLTFLAAALGTLAMPGTPGFEAAHLALEGMLESFHWISAYAAAAGNVLVASVLLWVYQRVFFTHESREAGAALIDLRGFERWVAGALCAVIFGAGLYAHPWIETVSASLEHLASTWSIIGGAN